MGRVKLLAILCLEVSVTVGMFSRSTREVLRPLRRMIGYFGSDAETAIVGLVAAGKPGAAVDKAVDEFQKSPSTGFQSLQNAVQKIAADSSIDAKDKQEFEAMYKSLKLSASSASSPSSILPPVGNRDISTGNSGIGTPGVNGGIGMPGVNDGIGMPGVNGGIGMPGVTGLNPPVGPNAFPTPYNDMSYGNIAPLSPIGYSSPMIPPQNSPLYPPQQQQSFPYNGEPVPMTGLLPTPQQQPLPPSGGPLPMAASPHTNPVASPVVDQVASPTGVDNNIVSTPSPSPVVASS